MIIRIILLAARPSQCSADPALRGQRHYGAPRTRAAGRAARHQDRRTYNRRPCATTGLPSSAEEGEGGGGDEGHLLIPPIAASIMNRATCHPPLLSRAT